MPRRRRGVDRRVLVARYAAPAAFLAAATVAVLLVRSGLRADDERPAATATTAVTTTATGTTTARGRTVPPRRFYRMRPGETLTDVAERFDTSVARLLELNPEVDPLALRVGQRIRVE